MALNYLIIDTETTGLSASHEIIQISVIRCSDKVQRTVNIKAEYPHRASPEALRIQGKTFHDLKFGSPKSEAVEIIHEFLLEDGLTPAHRCIVGHNVPFDRRFLFSTWESVNKKFPADLWLCTKEFTRKLAKRKGLVKPKLNLQASMEIAGLQPKLGAHNAVVDTMNTNELFQTLMNENLNHLSLIKNIPHSG